VAREVAAKATGGGWRPIVGCQVTIDMEGQTEERRGHQPVKAPAVVLLAANAQGYETLGDLVSRAYLGGEGHQAVHIRPSWLAEGGTEGLIALTGDRKSVV